MRKIATVQNKTGQVTIYWNAEWQEYVCKPEATRTNEDSWYHTDNKDDALATAHCL